MAKRPEVVNAYIGQICRQILVEAAANNVSKIDWRFSYPTAFSPIHANAFQNICNINLTNAYQETGFSNVTPAIEMWQESKAAAYYFRTFGNAFQFGAGALCIDIGAGTTDITAISSAPNVVIFHTSPFATPANPCSSRFTKTTTFLRPMRMLITEMQTDGKR